MSFQAKRLRVQLPCGEATVIEEEAQQAGGAGLCRIPSFCAFPTACHFATDQCLCTLGTPCDFGTWGCHRFFSCVRFGSEACRFDSPCGALASLCEIPSACGPSRICPGGSDQPVDPGTIVVDPEHLPALREALEAQLKEIETAEQALKERGGQEEG
jgi:hypothetical protein